MRVLRYGLDGVTVHREARVEELSSLRVPGEVLWISVVGLGDADILHRVAGAFSVHELTLEDIVSTHQRPKAEQFPGYDYVALRLASTELPLRISQLSLVVGDGYVVSFEVGSETQLEPVRRRITSGAGIIRAQAADFLAYALIDLVVDHYFPLLDAYADRMEAMEGQVLRDVTPAILQELFAVKEDLRECRHSIAPVRDVLGALMREEHAHFSGAVRLHLRDCFDHVVQILELIESQRDTVTGLMELHVSSVGNRMNEVMKVLTIIATLFMPLSFIAGVYGMNFDAAASPWNMPELHTRWGYPVVLVVMALVVVGMLLYFRARGWTGTHRTPPRGLAERGSSR